jgi:hypothetical protein
MTKSACKKRNIRAWSKLKRPVLLIFISRMI